MTIGDDYAGSDFYCDVAIPHAPEFTVVHDDDHVLAFHHTKPHWETHVVVVPKRHIASLTSATAADTPALQALFAVVQKIVRHVEEREGAAAVLTNLGAYQDSKHLISTSTPALGHTARTSGAAHSESAQVADVRALAFPHDAS